MTISPARLGLALAAIFGVIIAGSALAGETRTRDDSRYTAEGDATGSVTVQ